MIDASSAASARPFARALRRLAFWSGAGLASLVLHRAIFAALYFDAERLAESAANFSDLLLQFLYGFYFDLATLPAFLLPLAIALPFYAAAARGGRLELALRILEFLQWLWLGALHLLLAASAYNFRFNAKHLGWEFFAYIEDADKLVGATLSESPGLVVLAIVLIAAFLASGWFLFLRGALRERTPPLPKTPRKRVFAALQVAGLLFATLGLLVTLARGGLQNTPLRAADAIRFEGAYLNNLALNGVFTALRDQADRSEFERFYPEDANVAFVQELLENRAAFLSERYPLLRYMPPRPVPGLGRPPRTPQERPNIVLVVMESFTAKFLKEHGGDPRIAPNLQALIDDGLYFERFIASGGRSANGLFCMAAGLPDRAGRTILRSNQVHNRLGGIGTMLAQQGYRSLWIRGAELAFDNTDNVFPRLGFVRNIGRDELDRLNPDGARVPAWGHHDESVFEVALQQMDEMHAEGGPFFAMAFSLSTHHPYAVPGPEWDFFEDDLPEREFLNAYRYSDHALGAFVRALRERPYGANTIVLVTADHAHHRNLNYLEDRHLPFVIYAPGRIAPGKIGATASQLDVLPTVLGLAGGDFLYAALGNDLRNPALRHDFAYYAGGSGTNAIGWVNDQFLFMTWIGAENRILLTAREPVSPEDLFAQFPAEGERLLARARHFHQFARMLELENRIWPPPAELEELLARLRQSRGADL